MTHGHITSPDSPAEFAELLDLLGIGADERVSICAQKPGGRFEALIPRNRADAEAVALSTPYVDVRDVWFGVNPVAPPEGYRGRGTVEHVARCSALFADVDLKAGGVADPAVADAVCNALAAALGQPPAAVVFSGHGGHPYWPLDPDDTAWTLDTEAKRTAATAIYRRFHRLCADVAARFGGRVDNVGELSRVLRVPGTYNRKDPGAPTRVELTAWPYGTGGPLTFAEVAEALDAYGVPERTEDRETLGAMMSEPAGWEFGAETTPYVAAMIAGWPGDLPAKRHGWLVGQSTRLASAHRLGRITEADHDKAIDVLAERFGWLLTNHGEKRKPTPGEVSGALAWGRTKAATFTDERAAEECGGTDTDADALTLHDDIDALLGTDAGQRFAQVDSSGGDDDDDAKMPGQARFTEAGLAEIVTGKALRGKYIKARGIGWLHWTGTHWRDCGDGPPTEAVRRYVIGRIRFFARKLAADPFNPDYDDAIKSWKSAASKYRIGAVLALAGNIVEIDADRLDTDLDLLNTPSGIVDLRTGELHPHDPARLMTKITRGAYRLNDDGTPYSHQDVDKALTALPETEREWFRNRIGQAITGHPTPDGVVPILRGGGENGKSAITTDGLVIAFGDYGYPASARLFSGEKGNDHSTERADLRGRRLVIGEELTEGYSLNITAVKRLADVGRITARKLYQDNSSFDASHSLFICTNHRPVIVETDHGTWRRLALVTFPYTFKKRAEEVRDDTDRLGDPTLKGRVKAGGDGQHDALVTWAVQGAMAWYADPAAALLPTPVIDADTRAWRADTDRILGYWTEQLVADPAGTILTTDMYGEFNGWLTANGHREWSLETFGSRFSEHPETKRYRVEFRRTRNPRGLSRPHSANTNLTGQARVWVGVRFRRAEDDMNAYADRADRADPCGESAGV